MNPNVHIADHSRPRNDHASPKVFDIRRQILRRLIEGSEFAAAIMPWGKIGPIRLPTSEDELGQLIRAHLLGAGAVVRFAPMDKPEASLSVKTLTMAAYTPTPKGCSNWIAFDLDGISHGTGGLIDPDHAAACISDRADVAGLLSGLLIVRSRSGVGRHVWLLFPGPIPMADACIGAAGLAVNARKVADQDARDFSEQRHAFACGDGRIAFVGQSGAFEVVPKACEPPSRGYAMFLPFSGAAAAKGGGVAVDVFSEPVKIIEPTAVPKCDASNWDRFLQETKTELSNRRRSPRTSRPFPFRAGIRSISVRTRLLLSGRTPQGDRDCAAYAAYAELIRSGVALLEAESLVRAGAVKCGLSVRQIESTLRSARRRFGGNA